MLKPVQIFRTPAYKNFQNLVTIAKIKGRTVFLLCEVLKCKAVVTPDSCSTVFSVTIFLLFNNSLPSGFSEVIKSFLPQMTDILF